MTKQVEKAIAKLNLAEGATDNDSLLIQDAIKDLQRIDFDKQKELKDEKDKLIMECLQICEACGIKNSDLISRLWKLKLNKWIFQK